MPNLNRCSECGYLGCECPKQPKRIPDKCGENHNVCNTRLKKEGGKSRCCFCRPHENCDFGLDEPTEPLKAPADEKGWEDRLKYIKVKSCELGGVVINEEILNEQIRHLLATSQQALVERIEREIKNLHNKSESRASELECSQDAYEYGLEDCLGILQKIKQ